MDIRGRRQKSDIRKSVIEEVVRLGPWHIDIEVTPEVSTRAFLDAPPGTYPEEHRRISFYDPRPGFLRRLRRAFPDGLAGRSVLDCACNCGAHLLYAREAGAGRCLGFDVRPHWIEQARFLAAHRGLADDEVRFEVCDLYDLPALRAGTFDVTLFCGIFYHLPDPVHGLKLAAEATEELLVLRTAVEASGPDGALVLARESPTHLMSGAHGLGWFPTGPEVLTGILHWLGFPEVRRALWRHAANQPAGRDLLELFAARRPGWFDAWDSGRAGGAAALAEAIETCVPPGATVLVVDSREPLPEVHSRRLLPVRGAAAALEAAPAADAAYAVVPADRRLERKRMLLDGAGHDWPFRIYEL